MQQIILHLDMNSFFASVAQADNVELRGKPVGVCEHLGGIIISPSREAKKLGIKTGTPVWEAKKLCPNIILVHTQAERYRFYHRVMVRIVSEFTASVEVYSIDEVFLDLTRVCNIRSPNKLKSQSANQLVNPSTEAVKITKAIKLQMKKEMGEVLTCSVGIASNKTLAKIGSDLKKPDGIVIIQNSFSLQEMERARERSNEGSGDVLYFTTNDLYKQLKLTDVPGIGDRQEKNLQALGIKTLEDLKNYPKSHLVRRFGPVQGHHLYNLGQLSSSWKAHVKQDQELKSIGHMYTLPKEFRRAEFFIPVLYKLCEMVGRRLRRKGLEGNVLHFFSYDKNYRSFGNSLKLGDYISEGREIFLQAKTIFRKVQPKGEWGFKLIGVTVANLRPYSQQVNLCKR
jgi:DNA polymerase-4